MAREVRQVRGQRRGARRGRRNLHVLAQLVDYREGDDFVERPLHEELHLAVLVGGAGRRHRRGPRVDGAALAIHALAQTLGPELTVPLGELPQPVRVRHEHVDPGAEVGVGRPVEGRVERGRVPQQIVGLRSLHRLAGAREQGGDVDAHQRRRQQAHRREHAEASADRRRHAQRGDSVAGGDLPQRATLGVGGEDEVPGGRRAERVLQPGPHHQVLRHRLRGAARLADDVDQHPPRIDAPERRRDRRGIDVVEHGEPREELAALVVPLVPGRAAERVEQRPRPERRPADAEHDARGRAPGRGPRRRRRSPGPARPDRRARRIRTPPRPGGGGPPPAPRRTGRRAPPSRGRGSPCTPSSPSWSMRP